MKVFRELSIHANADAMAAAVAGMEKALPADWVRDKAAEARTQSIPSLTKRAVYCFVWKEGDRRAAMLVLAQKDADTFYASNIVPLDRREFEHAAYNAVLEDFYDRVFRPYAERAKLEHTLSEPEADLEQWLDAHTAKLLRTFSSGANKGTGASHPADRERWNAFVLSAHQSGSTLDPSTLARWLVEVEDWSPEVAEQLALEYESGLGLLAFASGR
jgi:hypothetical protein